MNCPDCSRPLLVLEHSPFCHHCNEAKHLPRVRVIPCEDCGVEFITAGARAVCCPACGQARIRVYKRVASRRFYAMNHSKPKKVVTIHLPPQLQTREPFCSDCSEQLLRPTPDGCCGSCRVERRDREQRCRT